METAASAEVDDAIFKVISGSRWRFNDGREGTFHPSGEFDTPTCKTGHHRECMWHVYHGSIVIEWSRQGVFLAVPQQAASSNDPTHQALPSMLTGVSVLNPNKKFTATLVERTGRPVSTWTTHQVGVDALTLNVTTTLQGAMIYTKLLQLVKMRRLLKSNELIAA